MQQVIQAARLLTTNQTVLLLLVLENAGIKLMQFLIDLVLRLNGKTMRMNQENQGDRSLFSAAVMKLQAR